MTGLVKRGWMVRSVFDTIDGIDQLGEQLASVTVTLDKLAAIQPQLVALLPDEIASQQINRELALANYATMSGIYAQTAALIENAAAMGQAFDAAKNDDSFYLPPEAFDNPDFQRGLKLFLSADGKAARMIISHEGDPATPEGISHIDAIKQAAHEAVKGTPMAGAGIYLAGTAATFKDIQDGATYDLLIAGIAALSLILLIMMIITRSLVAALVIVGTVALSLGASFGLSVLVWQHLLGIQLYWIVLALAVILLLAVGSDYNLLLISRFKEEIGAGLNTGIIRAMAGTGGVVTAAGLVFAATMSSFVFSDLRVLGQIGTTIGLGLLFDTLVVRAFMTPSIAVLLGRWFWWPQRVRPRPASRMLRPYGPLSGEYAPSPLDWSREQADTYMKSGGTEGTQLQGKPVILLTTVGAKTGKLRKTPLMRVEHDGQYAIVASLGGAPKNPVWYHNVVKNPRVELQDGTVTGDYDAREVFGDEKAIWWQRAVAVWPDYASYQTKTDRQIPVFVLTPVRAGG